MATSLEDLIAATSELQSLPSTTLRLIELLDDVTADASEVLDVIEKDPSLTTNLLKLANSAFYGVSGRVGSARDALILLGNQTVVNLAFATSMGDILRGPLAAYRLGRNDLWHHALGTALAAAYLASLTGGKEARERAFTGGLVHDIGKLILNRPLKQELEVIPESVDFAGLLAAESGILGYDHAEAGAALAGTWGFPPQLVRLIRYHHDARSADDDGDLVRAVAAANLATCQADLGGGTPPLPDADFREAMEELVFPLEIVESLVASLPGDLESMLNLTGDSLK